MHRKNKPQGLLFGAVALAILVGAFMSSPIAANQETDPDDGGADGFFVGHGPGGMTDRNGSGGQEDGDDGDSTDPDWFGFTSWNQYGTWSGQRVEFGPTRVVYDPVNSPFVFAANWLLQQVSSQYLRLW
jgi:hypothetical protein